MGKAREYSWLDIVSQMEPDYYASIKGVYEFSGGRRFDSTDKLESSGIYGGGIDEIVEIGISDESFDFITDSTGGQITECETVESGASDENGVSDESFDFITDSTGGQIIE